MAGGRTMKKQAKEITVGKATKYKRVKFDVAKIIALYKSGKPVSHIATAIGFPPNCGQKPHAFFRPAGPGIGLLIRVR
jgi:hypothetical protein